jgi:hypothetical protein
MEVHVQLELKSLPQHSQFRDAEAETAVQPACVGQLIEHFMYVCMSQMPLFQK